MEDYPISMAGAGCMEGQTCYCYFCMYVICCIANAYCGFYSRATAKGPATRAMLHTRHGMYQCPCDVVKSHAMRCNAFSNMLVNLLLFLEYLGYLVFDFSNGFYHNNGHSITCYVIFV